MPCCHLIRLQVAEVVEISRNQIQEDSAQSVKAAVDDLSNRLRASKNDLAKQCRADNETDETLIKPLGDEELRYARPDGSQVGSAPLSTRFKKFQNTIVEEEEKLKSLFEQLAQVNEEIAEDAEAALGPDWAKVVGCAPFGKSRDVVHEDGKETDKEMQEIQTHFEELIGNVSEKHLEEMKASEKVCLSRVYVIELMGCLIRLSRSVRRRIRRQSWP